MEERMDLDLSINGSSDDFSVSSFHLPSEPNAYATTLSETDLKIRAVQ